MLSRWKEKKEQKCEEKESLSLVEREKVESALKDITDEMLSKECPIKGDKCFKECVHFKSGKVGIFFEHWSYSSPECKLWR